MWRHKTTSVAVRFQPGVKTRRVMASPFSRSPPFSSLASFVFFKYTQQHDYRHSSRSQQGPYTGKIPPCLPKLPPGDGNVAEAQQPRVRKRFGQVKVFRSYSLWVSKYNLHCHHSSAKTESTDVVFTTKCQTDGSCSYKVHLMEFLFLIFIAGMFQ